MNTHKSNDPPALGKTKKDLITWIKHFAKAIPGETKEIELPISLERLVKAIDSLSAENRLDISKNDDIKKARFILKKYTIPEIHEQTRLSAVCIKHLVKNPYELKKASWETVHKLSAFYDQVYLHQEKLAMILSGLSDKEVLVLERLLAAAKKKRF